MRRWTPFVSRRGDTRTLQRLENHRACGYMVALPARRRDEFAEQTSPLKEACMLRVLAVTALLALFAGPALADNGFYLGASIGQANVDINDLDNYDANDTGFKGIVGFRALGFLALEASYVDFGSPSDDVLGVDVTADGNGVDAFVVGMIPLPMVDLFAKVGYIHWNVDLSAQGLGSLGDDSGDDLAYGVGAALKFGSWSIRAEYEEFDIEDVNANMLSLGFTYTFF
jgi:OOP family OmpA-OmpF porin